MRKIAVFVLLVCACTCCKNKQASQSLAPNKILKAPQELYGNHALYKMGARETLTNGKCVVRFAWQAYDSSYIFSEIELAKIRVVVANSVDEPYVVFTAWNEYEQNSYNPPLFQETESILLHGTQSEKFSRFVKEMTIYVSCEDWTNQLYLPMEVDESDP